MKRRRFLLSAAALLAGAGATGSGAAPAGPTQASPTAPGLPEAARRPWRLLVLQPLSGPGQDFGEAIARGVALWAGVRGPFPQGRPVAGTPRAGPTVDVRWLDTRGVPQEAERMAWEWAGEADLVVAPYGSAATRAVMAATERLGVPLLAPGAGDEALWEETSHRFAFQLLPGNRRVWQPALAWAASHGLDALALVYRRDPFTLSTMHGARLHAPALSLRIAGEATVEPDAPPDRLLAACRSLLDDLRRTGRRAGTRAPVVLGGGYLPGRPIAGFGPDAAALVRGARSASPDVPVIGLVAPAHPAFAELLAPAEGDGVGGVTSWQPWLDDPASRAFAAAFRRAYGADPDTHAAFGYAAGEVFAAAAGTPEHPLAESLRQLEVSTLVGTYRVDTRGLQQGIGYRLTTWRAGSLEVVA